MKDFKRTTKKQLGELLVARGVIDREKVAMAMACQYGFPFLPLSNYEIDPEVITSVPENVCRQFCLIPIDKIGKSLTLAMADPLNVQAIEDVELLSDCSVQTFVSTTSDIRRAIDKYYK